MSIDVQQRVVAIPGEDGNFPLYNTLKMFDQDWMREMNHKYGDIYQTKTISGQVVYVDDYELVRRLQQEDSGLVEQFFLQSTCDLLGPESFLGTNKHQEMRSFFNPLFSYNKMAQKMDSIRDVVESVLQKYFNQEGNVIQVYELAQWYTAQVMQVILFGELLDDKQASNFLQYGWDYIRGFVNPFAINLPFFAYGKAIRARKQLLVISLIKITISSVFRPMTASNTMEAQLNERIEHVKEGSLLDTFLKGKDADGNKFKKQTIEDIMMHLIFAGLVTSTDMLARIFWFLSVHPEVTQRLRQEIDNIDLSTCDAKYIANLNYLDAIIKESFRLNTVVPQVIYKSKTKIYYKNYIIPKNTIIFLHYQGIFLNDKRFAGMKGEMAPQKFCPKRWFEPIALERGDTFVPYGMGVRMCLGMHLADLEMKMLLMNIVQKYEWEMVNKESDWIGLSIQRPKDGLPIRFKPRIKKQLLAQNRYVSCGLYIKSGNIKAAAR